MFFFSIWFLMRLIKLKFMNYFPFYMVFTSCTIDLVMMFVVCLIRFIFSRFHDFMVLHCFFSFCRAFDLKRASAYYFGYVKMGENKKIRKKKEKKHIIVSKNTWKMRKKKIIILRSIHSNVINWCLFIEISLLYIDRFIMNVKKRVKK